MKKRRINFYNLTVVAFVLTVIFYLGVSIVLHSFNVNLASRLMENEAKIEALQAEVDAITIQVKELTDYNRVMDTVDGDLNSNNSIVVSIENGAN